MRYSAAREIHEVERNKSFRIVVESVFVVTKIIARIENVAMSDGTPNVMMARREPTGEIIGTTRTARQDTLKQLKADAIHANKQVQDAQAQYKRHFDAHLHPTNDNVLLEDSV